MSHVEPSYHASCRTKLSCLMKQPHLLFKFSIALLVSRLPLGVKGREGRDTIEGREGRDTIEGREGRLGRKGQEVRLEWKARRSGRAGDGCRSMSIPFAACFESIWVGLHASIRHGS